MIIFAAILAFYVAWNLGANDVANSMGTSVGSKALSLKQALLVAGILEFLGAVLFGKEVSSTLATEIVNPEMFINKPAVLITGMMVVMVAGALWVQVATLKGWPVSSSHAIVGAIAGFSWVAAGKSSVDWSNIGIISITWILTPVVSGIVASGFYACIKKWILQQNEPIKQLQEWIPWLSSALVGVFGFLVLPSVLAPAHLWLINHTGLNFPAHDLSVLVGAGAAVSITFFTWHKLKTLSSHSVAESSNSGEFESPMENVNFKIEKILGRFQVLSACFVAFAHGSNDVGNAIAPLAAINYIKNTGTVPLESFNLPFWVLVLGGLGIVAGLAVLGKRVITTVGEKIIELQPSAGFSAELATATTVLVASRLGLPVSTSHALVGGVVGVGIVRSLLEGKKQLEVSGATLRGILWAWVVTVPIAAGLSALIFTIVSRFI
ncbi:inorganic phosphate transporter [Ancylothrix sp. C2]|uniref:inorganic phosphate transporter n=1 Tax=Ancylothrix sp. D3o TaxID=2953691 RepID=UPI0021BA5D5E|nr:inorganic phosphate transporter [Ancylothrix sp. D3o]MCT7951639.1 inorganic phosphate transporter [Ancylothrix sp. D3o]